MADRIIETVIEYETQPPCKTAAEMENVCCEETPALQCCEKTDGGTWSGYSASELMDMYYPNMSEVEKLYFRMEVQPRKNPCGYKYTEYDVSSGNCCDEATDIEWDEDESVDFIADESHGRVTVTGGLSPYKWTSHSAGAFFDSARSRKTVYTSSPSVQVHLSDEACGTIQITVTDGCTSLDREIRTEDGHWETIGSGSFKTGSNTEIYPLDRYRVDGEYIGNDGSGNHEVELITGSSKVLENQQTTYHTLWPNYFGAGAKMHSTADFVEQCDTYWSDNCPDCETVEAGCIARLEGGIGEGVSVAGSLCLFGTNERQALCDCYKHWFDYGTSKTGTCLGSVVEEVSGSNFVCVDDMAENISAYLVSDVQGHYFNCCWYSGGSYIGTTKSQGFTSWVMRTIQHNGFTVYRWVC